MCFETGSEAMWEKLFRHRVETKQRLIKYKFSCLMDKDGRENSLKNFLHHLTRRRKFYGKFNGLKFCENKKCQLFRDQIQTDLVFLFLT